VCTHTQLSCLFHLYFCKVPRIIFALEHAATFCSIVISDKPTGLCFFDVHRLSRVLFFFGRILCTQNDVMDSHGSQTAGDILVYLTSSLR
jgi:hypothetical protein